MTVLPLPDLLRRHANAAAGYVEPDIFGTTDPEQMADLITGAVDDLTGVPVVGASFYAASAGCVVGLRLADGQTVVCKVYQPHWELPFLQACQRVQRALHRSGYPCSSPLAGPVPLGHGLATLESYLPDPGPTRTEDQQMAGSVSGLVQLMALARGAEIDGLHRHPFRMATGDLYPTPHSPIFDFDATREGAAWIDEIAREARAERDSGDLPLVIAHMDWSARNVRLDRHGVTAVYDWDSLSMAPEAVAAGQAAATWRSTGETGDGVAPGSGEIEDFLEAFGVARGVPLVPGELSAARAAAVWVMAYSARCEHALEQRTPYIRQRARDWLGSQARQLL